MRWIVTLGLLAALSTAATAQAQSLGTVPCVQGYCPVQPTSSMAGFPVAVAQRVITKTQVAANTSTTVCPAPAVINGTPKLIHQELQAQTGGGIGLQGQALTSATFGTGAGTPDIVLTAAASEYSWPDPPANASTFYGGVTQFVTCIQDYHP